MNEANLGALVDSGNLDEVLQESLAGVHRKHVAIALQVGGRSAFASCADDATVVRGRVGFGGVARAHRHGAPIPLGCITKLVTAEIALDAVKTGSLDLDSPVPVPGRKRGGKGEQLTLRHLLEHTHGLDDSLLERAPRRADGRIDERTLWAQLRGTRPLAAPGETYSYGNAGAWLTAALLERVLRHSYAELVEARVAQFAPRGSSAVPLSSVADRARLCAALGGTLAWPLADVLAFVVAHALERSRRWPAETCAGTFGGTQSLPGWNPLEHGVHVGWKTHGNGWFGHASTWPGAAMLVRAHPARRIALVIVSKSHPAPVIAGRVFGRWLPELFEVRLPTLRAAGRDGSADSRWFAGLYASAARSVHVRADNGRLTAEIVERCADGHSTSSRATLREAADGVFFTEPPAFPTFAYVQFLQHRAATQRLLWNGRFVLRAAE